MKIVHTGTLIHERPAFDTSHLPQRIHPSSREKGWRSHECAAEFRELLNEPSSRKPLITKGLGEEARAGKEKPIFGAEPKPQIFREKLPEQQQTALRYPLFF